MDKICLSCNVSFDAYTAIDSNFISRPLDGFMPIVMKYDGQFDYASTTTYAGHDSTVFVPIDAFSSFINPGHMTDDLSAYVAAATRAGAAFITVSWNEED